MEMEYSNYEGLLKKLLALALVFALLLCAAPLACAEDMPVFSLEDDGTVPQIGLNNPEIGPVADFGPLRMNVNGVKVNQYTNDSKSYAAFFNARPGETVVSIAFSVTVENVTGEMCNFDPRAVCLTANTGETVNIWPFSSTDTTAHMFYVHGTVWSGALFFVLHQTEIEELKSFILCFSPPWNDDFLCDPFSVAFLMPGVESLEAAQTRSGALSLFAEPEEYTYILNTHTKKFHLPTCDSVNQIQDENKQFFTGSREELTAAGYSPCGNCNP